MDRCILVGSAAPPVSVAATLHSSWRCHRRQPQRRTTHTRQSLREHLRPNTLAIVIIGSVLHKEHVSLDISAVCQPLRATKSELCRHLSSLKRVVLPGFRPQCGVRNTLKRHSNKETLNSAKHEQYTRVKQLCPKVRYIHNSNRVLYVLRWHANSDRIAAQRSLWGSVD